MPVISAYKMAQLFSNSASPGVYLYDCHIPSPSEEKEGSNDIAIA